MTESELKGLCSYKPKAVRHWTSEIYGFGPVIRSYGFYPASLPLTIYMAHGLTMAEKPSPHELSNDATAMLYFSPRLVDAYRKVSKKPCYCIISPNVYYRRSRGINRRPDAKGTLVFLAHTTPLIEDKMNMTAYIDQLKALPAKYHPLTICLHYHDVNKGVYKTFMRLGMEVVTVGSPHHPGFIDRFYKIVCGFRYATSNDVGSYTFYCAEMGLPFFLYGERPDLHNSGDLNIESGKYDSYTKTNQFRKTTSLFSEPVDEVTPEQRAFVEEELGVKNTISRRHLSLLLYTGFVRAKLSSLRNLLSIKRMRTFFSARAQQLGMYVTNMKLFGFDFASSLFFGRRKMSVRLFGKNLSYSNRFWFLHSMREIFIDRTYEFRSSTESPVIIDCGSNIGLSVIDFKRQYPKARIIGFEPDARNFELLTRNIRAFGYDDVELLEKAVWTSDTTLAFDESDNSVGSKLATSSNSKNSREVEAVALASYLRDRQVEFLKMDIEGAEYDVILSCREYLDNVRNLFIEYHSFPGQPQRLNEILTILTNSGFRYYIKEAWVNRKRPFSLHESTLFDLQLNIFAYRP